MMILQKYLNKSTAVSRMLAAIQSHKKANLSNVRSGLKGFLSWAVFQSTQSHIVYIAPTEKAAREIAAFMKALLEENAMCYPAEPIHTFFADAYSKEIIAEQLKVIASLDENKQCVIVLSVESLLRKTAVFRAPEKAFLNLTVGEVTDYSELIEKIAEMGYLRVDQIEGAGQFAVRGDIIDLHDMTESQPWRIEFFDDEIERICTFDLQSQRSVTPLKNICIAPVEKNLLSKESRQDVIRRITTEYGDKPQYARLIESIRQHPEEHAATLAAFSDRNMTLLSALHDPVIILDDPEAISEAAMIFLQRAENALSGLIEHGEAFPEEWAMFLSRAQLAAELEKYPAVIFNAFDAPKKDLINIDLGTRSHESFVGQPKLFGAYLDHKLREGQDICIFCQNEASKEKIEQYITSIESEEWRVESEDKEDISALCAEISSIIAHCTLHIAHCISSGFEWPEVDLCVIKDSEILKPQTEKRRRKHRIKGKKIDSFTQLKKGDLVVHDLHGIGIYRGIEQIEIDGYIKDLMAIEYAGDARFYLSVEDFDAVQVYIGGKDEDHRPRLNTLGRPEWRKAKAKARKAVEDMADELIALYAKRQSLQGYAFSTDTVWQREFEDAFIYEETDDQLQCIDEIKADMERAVPMDRLLCGDVGFGKTEVALRAAFKAVMDGKQVAFLVPTTVLAQQHYHTVIDRFKNTPVEIGLLNRFKSAKEQKQIIADLKDGKIDIVIGTHRLLSKDIDFKDLGLLIIDEEQRFGVRAKEKLKSLKTDVDVLTLSATPIPRTLHMSMTGVRDISTIEEPPAGRRPVQTFVMQMQPAIIADAIERELLRGGQVFVVHNRVYDIESRAAAIQVLVPEARIAVAHGQMTGNALEKIMLDFNNREYDVLVATTIIESGMDMPNVNTMIVDQGDTFGLSQLYQLRGRIGRSDRQAYCYITHKRQTLSEIAAKRLKAIRDFTAFGSGFKVAMRDLEIRGSGNILGAEQSGHLFNIGYEMYCRILNETVENKLKGIQTAPADIPVKLSLIADAYVPENYIDSDTLKYDIYKKIAYVRSEADFETLQEELSDRFGNVPVSVENLMIIAMIKHAAKKRNLIEIRQQGRLVKFIFSEEGEMPFIEPKKMPELFARYALKLKGDRYRDRVWSITLQSPSPTEQLKMILRFMQQFE